MEYYGNNDWRDYLRRQNELAHFGIPKRSGRYPWGSGENPYHHGASAPGGYKKKKQKELRDFTTADNRRIGRAAMQYGPLVGLATIRDIQKGRQDTQYSKYTEPELDRIASSRNSLKGYLLGGIIAGKLEEKKIDRDKKILGDKYKQFSEYTDEQIKRMDEAHGKPHGEERSEWYRVMKENAKAINAARKEAKAEQKVVPKEKLDEETAKATINSTESKDRSRYFRDSSEYNNYEDYLDDYVHRFDNDEEYMKEEKARISKEDVGFDPSDLKEVNKILRESNHRELTNDERKKLDTVILEQLSDWEADGLSKRDFELKQKVLKVIDSDESKRYDKALNDRISDAKNNDRYDLDFIEAIQNKQILEDGHETERLKAYEEYLRDPEDFWKNKVNKYKDA